MNLEASLAEQFVTMEYWNYMLAIQDIERSMAVSEMNNRALKKAEENHNKMLNLLVEAWNKRP